MLENSVAEMKENQQKERSLDDSAYKINAIFPTLSNYKAEHTLNGFKKLCFEIAEFCQQVYASTQNEEERKIYENMVEKLKH